MLLRVPGINFFSNLHVVIDLFHFPYANSTGYPQKPDTRRMVQALSHQAASSYTILNITMPEIVHPFGTPIKLMVLIESPIGFFHAPIMIAVANF